jgi:protein-S-isoprenylcysteine O-methyltransferase Ste14
MAFDYHRSWLRFRVPLGFLFAAWFLAVARPAFLGLFIVCFLFVAAGVALRAWAAGYLLKGKRVAVGGPYAYIRNPLYAGSFLIGVGFCLTLWRQPLPVAAIAIWSAFLIGFVIVYPAKTRTEEKELENSLGKPYTQYAAQVPRFFPVRGRVSGLGEQRYSAELYKRNREIQCLLGSAAILLYLLGRYVLAL